jgi:hypothetical protein
MPSPPPPKPGPLPPDGRPIPGQPPLITDMTLELAPGSRCLLIGANGAGKTTLLKILGGKHMVDRVRGRAHLQPPIVFGRGAAGGRQPLTCFGRAPVWGRDLGRGLAKRPPPPPAPRAPPLRAPRPALARPAPRPHAPRAPPSRAPRPALARPAPRRSTSGCSGARPSTTLR